ncbi:hypothetical protein M407DRAFT_186804 [Tulasnella calospora MUT 4182]|uniref:F-box domain-containing protein n=1 Tax=Tulasnella calospora MUT 4182 TaxID=1051891 RepID=A0A0C3MIZ9_9AGAM|nr:hypothetical protein M407DRAFT_186804 [Tulasnella calospora MUT 4182]
MLTTFINTLPKGLDGFDKSTEDCGSVLGSRSGKWATPPPECLSLVFEARLERIFPKGEFAKETKNDDELCQFISAITQTCRWWRQVALETSRIWSTLILNQSTLPKKLETWLARSKAAPLYINFQGDLVYSTVTSTLLLTSLHKHIHRWGRLRLFLNSPWGMENFFKAVGEKDAPLLERLSLGTERAAWNIGRVSATKIFNGPDSLPKLSEVDLSGVWWDWKETPFRNLRSLSLTRLRNGDELSVEQFKNLLLESQQLTRLRLVGHAVRLGDIFRPMNQTPQPISLPSLNTLLISHYPHPEILNFTLRLIHAPNLKNLRLADLEEGRFRLDFTSTFELLGTGSLSSFERLEVLELRRVACGSGAAWDLFCAKLTNLRDLILRHMRDELPEPRDGYTGFLNSLVPSVGADVTGGWEVRCGNLRSLLVSGCSERPVIDFVEQRLRAGYGISQVMYEGNPDSSIAELATLGVECALRFDAYSGAGTDPWWDDNWNV